LRGIGFILAAAVLYFFLRDPINLVVLGGLGVINLLIMWRPILILNGVFFVLMALINGVVGVFGLLAPGGGNSTGPFILTILQLGWGAQEFEKYKSLTPKPPAHLSLLKKLEDPHEATRASALQELGRLDYSNDKIINGLQAATRDDYESVRRAATQALSAPAHVAWMQKR